MSAKHEIATRIYDFFFSQYTSSPNKADLAFVFARNDPTLARVTSLLWHRDLVDNVVVTGGVGKDSGDLPMAEADFLASLMYTEGVSGNKLLIERHATNGAENTKFGMKKVIEVRVPYQKIILVGHATNLLRLFASHTLIARDMGADWVEYQLYAPPYELKESDSEILISEYKRLLDWPQKQWADQIELPPELTSEVLSITQV